MENEFNCLMSIKSDVDLIKIVTAEKFNYQALVVEAAIELFVKTSLVK